MLVHLQLLRLLVVAGPTALPDGGVEDYFVTTLAAADPSSLSTAAAAPVVVILASVIADVAGP